MLVGDGIRPLTPRLGTVSLTINLIVLQPTNPRLVSSHVSREEILLACFPGGPGGVTVLSEAAQWWSWASHGP